MGRGAAIVVDGVTKKYRKMAHAHRYQTLKSALLGGDLFAALAADEVFTALDGISVTIDAGETFGVIGHNGAGKSTLLKIIAGTTVPTEGTVEVDGKISALIELGAGFHPEISGRENVFINGIMLGLDREQISDRFDEIVRFAGLEEFIDAPVKTYSSGMYMRLGFSVAIHVDPDVLLIDEVLAVGDEAFVHKCLDKIAEFKRRGKTILLVSHGLEQVRRLCDRAMWMSEGRIERIGDPPRVIDTYLDWVAGEEEEQLAERHERQRAATAEATGGEEPALPAATRQPSPSAAPEGVTSGSQEAHEAAGAPAAGRGAERKAEAESGEEGPYEPGRWGNRRVAIDRVRLLDRVGEQRYVFGVGDPMTVEMEISAEEPTDDFVFGLGVFNPAGVCCYGTNTDIERFVPDELSGPATVRIEIPGLELVQGTYYLDLAVHRRDGFAYDYQRGLVTFRTTSQVGDVGVARLNHRWRFEGGVRWKQEGGIEASRDAGPE